MDSLVIEHLDPAVKGKLRERAERHGLSVAQEAERILSEALLGAPSMDRSRKPSTPEEIELRVQRILALGRRPAEPIDWKAESDALWAFIE